MSGSRGARRVRRSDPTRALQVGLLVLLAVCALQLAWWVYDEFAYTAAVRDAQVAAYQRDVDAARAMFTRGVDRESVAQLYPHLRAQDGFALSDEVRAEVDGARWHRLNRTVWEGIFFLAVLVAGMAILVRALRQEGELRRRQQNFLAAVTHELKSPLASVRLAAETLALRDRPPEDRARLVGRILGDVDRLGVMVSNILDTGRLDEGRVELVAVRLDLGQALREAAGDVEAHARSRQAVLEVEHEGELSVEADPTAVRSVLRNLLDNAIKAVPSEGGGRVRARARREDGRVRVDVEDDGRGFPPSESARLFEKFYRSGDELRRTSEGSGLGLFLVKRLVELQGGDVEAASDGPGRGARFTVRWPAAEEAA